MAEELGAPITPETGEKKNNTLLIVIIVIVVLCCCCCAGAAAVYYGIEPLMEFLGMQIPW